MRLTVVGCSGSFPGPDSPASCYLLEAEGFRVLLDLGSGALGPLQRHVSLDDLDAVLLSHLHPDHFMDLCGLYVARRYHPDGPRRRLPVHGPSATARRLVAAYGDDAGDGMDAEFEFLTWSERPLALGPLTVTVAAVNHPVEAFGMRVEHEGRVLAYSGDSDDCDGLRTVAADADLFLCEASFQEGRDDVRDLHLTGHRAGAVASEVRARRLLLTHLPPWNDPARCLEEARGSYGGSVELAEPGRSYDV